MNKTIHEKIWVEVYTQPYLKTRMSEQIEKQIKEQVSGHIRYDISDKVMGLVRDKVWMNVGRKIKTKAFGYEIIHPLNPFNHSQHYYENAIQH